MEDGNGNGKNMRHPAPGPDPDFPYLSEYDRYAFPKPDSQRDGVVAIGGNLSPGMLLSAYEQGIFPWYNPDDPILWQSPDPRMVLFPKNLHISRSMKKVFTQARFTVALDRNFYAVIKNCADRYRPGQYGTWITDDIIAAYTQMHYLGWAHSAECYADEELVGGCYGMRLGAVFFGESMFAVRPNASKTAFLSLARLLFDDGVDFIDCQVYTDHLASLGAVEMPKSEFLPLLRETLALRYPLKNSPNDRLTDIIDRRGNWNLLYPSCSPASLRPPEAGSP
ncbi:MAG: leucyl/phenylalanyl-tRNA--protein transferase [Spirochaetaceae bacterium]|jgi:leucyl/phenylalanyl-tRNA--protein transferase|nr:leucyl/phenylalanyl-tRNA--protein transferase [Spirochaetaceae bacterium]